MYRYRYSFGSSSSYAEIILNGSVMDRVFGAVGFWGGLWQFFLPEPAPDPEANRDRYI